jgi:hypothetical protein
MRWLLVVLTLTGLGLPYGGHCDDARAPHPASVVQASHVEFVATEVVAERAARHRDDCPASMTTVQECRPLTSSVAAAPAAATARAVYSAHDVRVAVGPSLSSGRALPALSLESLGVSRT